MHARTSLCALAPLVALVLGPLVACGPVGGANPTTATPTTLPPTRDPATLATAVGAVQLVNVAAPDACLGVAPAAAAASGTAVGTSPCTGAAAQSWRWQLDGTLGLADTGLCLASAASPAAAGGALVVRPCRADGSQRLTFARGRLYLAAGLRGATNAVLAAQVGDGTDFAPCVLAEADANSNPPQQWRVGRADRGVAGDPNVQVTGVPLALAASPSMCLTGRGITVGLAACNGSASQAWVLGEAGGVQLGAYCLDATTPGTIAQGTPGQFKLCRTGSPGQAWQVDAFGVTLGELALSPTTVPPPAAGYTPTALVQGQVAWRIGG